RAHVGRGCFGHGCSISVRGRERGPISLKVGTTLPEPGAAGTPRARCRRDSPARPTRAATPGGSALPEQLVEGREVRELVLDLLVPAREQDVDELCPGALDALAERGDV